MPIFGQSGDNRYENADKMILKQVDVLPHGLINNIDEKLGRDGGKLKEYIRWLVDRIERHKPREDYRPVLHIDVYGTIGVIFDNDPLKVADYMAGLASRRRAARTVHRRAGRYGRKTAAVGSFQPRSRANCGA